MSEWLKQLQASDETTKKRWVVILSIAAMLVVVALWIALLTNTLRETPADSTAQAPATPGFFTNIANGLSSFYHGLVSGIGGFFRSLGNPKSYHIQPH